MHLGTGPHRLHQHHHVLFELTKQFPTLTSLRLSKWPATNCDASHLVSSLLLCFVNLYECLLCCLTSQPSFVFYLLMTSVLLIFHLLSHYRSPCKTYGMIICSSSIALSVPCSLAQNRYLFYGTAFVSQIIC